MTWVLMSSTRMCEWVLCGSLLYPCGHVWHGVADGLMPPINVLRWDDEVAAQEYASAHRLPGYPVLAHSIKDWKT